MRLAWTKIEFSKDKTQTAEKHFFFLNAQHPQPSGT